MHFESKSRSLKEEILDVANKICDIWINHRLSLDASAVQEIVQLLQQHKILFECCYPKQRIEDCELHRIYLRKHCKIYGIPEKIYVGREEVAIVGMATALMKLWTAYKRGSLTPELLQKVIDFLLVMSYLYDDTITTKNFRLYTEEEKRKHIEANISLTISFINKFAEREELYDPAFVKFLKDALKEEYEKNRNR